jgi:hypothetical protein
MARAAYDPERAARRVRELAATTDSELIAGIRAVAAEVLDRGAARGSAGKDHP